MNIPPNLSFQILFTLRWEIILIILDNVFFEQQRIDIKTITTDATHKPKIILLNVLTKVFLLSAKTPEIKAIHPFPKNSKILANNFFKASFLKQQWLKVNDLLIIYVRNLNRSFRSGH